MYFSCGVKLKWIVLIVYAGQAVSLRLLTAKAVQVGFAESNVALRQVIFE